MTPYPVKERNRHMARTTSRRRDRRTGLLVLGAGALAAGLISQRERIAARFSGAQPPEAHVPATVEAPAGPVSDSASPAVDAPALEPDPPLEGAGEDVDRPAPFGPPVPEGGDERAQDQDEPRTWSGL